MMVPRQIPQMEESPSRHCAFASETERCCETVRSYDGKLDCGCE